MLNMWSLCSFQLNNWLRRKANDHIPNPYFWNLNCCFCRGVSIIFVHSANGSALNLISDCKPHAPAQLGKLATDNPFNVLMVATSK